MFLLPQALAQALSWSAYGLPHKSLCSSLVELTYPREPCAHLSHPLEPYRPVAGRKPSACLQPPPPGQLHVTVPQVSPAPYPVPIASGTA